RVYDELLRSLWRHGLAYFAFRALTVAYRPLDAMARLPTALGWAYRGVFKVRRREVRSWLRSRFEIARPVPFRADTWTGRGVCGTGIYFRADFWNRMTSGGSYGHTCYVAKEMRD